MDDAELCSRLELRRQTVLARFGELALRSTDLDEILTEACRLVGDVFGTDLAKIMESRNNGEILLVRAGVGWNPGIIRNVTIKVADDTSEGLALKTGQPMIALDIAQETKFHYPSFLTDHNVIAVANVPIIGGKDRPPFGILEVDSRTRRVFTDEDTAFLSGYANLIAAAVDRLQVMGEVREAETRLRLALDAGRLGDFEWDVQADAVRPSGRARAIFGFAQGEGECSADYFARIVPEDLASTRADIEQGLAVGRVVSHYRVRLPSGAVRHVRSEGNVVRDGGGAPTRLIGVFADETERLSAEAALRHINETLEAQVAERTRALAEANAKLRAEAEERERVEDALRQSQKMEAVGQLTGGIAHDFNNLLAGISGSLELMRTRAAQGRTAELGRYIDAAFTSANRAAALTHRLLAFSRRQTLDPRPTDINRLVTGMEELVGRTVGPGTQVEMRLAIEPWPILCDPNKLEDALVNLAINARDAMPDGGQLLIETANADLKDQRETSRDPLLSIVPPGEYVALSIADTGTGMTPDVLARAFDPFFTTKPMGQGTGLGLSMIYGFVQQSGGYVRLCSEPGRGTTATLYLPRHLGVADGEAMAEAVTKAAAARENAVVLVVEDEPAVRMIIVDVLSDLGYTILEADDGSSGLGIVESRARIDLLLTDVGLPGGLNGRQLADAARARRPGLRVLFVTGYAEAAVFGSGLLDQGMQVMTKPFVMDALVARVQNMITG